MTATTRAGQVVGIFRVRPDTLVRDVQVVIGSLALLTTPPIIERHPLPVQASDTLERRRCSTAFQGPNVMPMGRTIAVVAGP